MNESGQIFRWDAMLDIRGSITEQHKRAADVDFCANFTYFLVANIFRILISYNFFYLQLVLQVMCYQ